MSVLLGLALLALGAWHQRCERCQQRSAALTDPARRAELVAAARARLAAWLS